MSLESATASLMAAAAQAEPLGHRLKFDLGADGSILWDGTGAAPVIDNATGEAETTIVISLANLESLIAGTLDPTMAYMTGKLKVEGAMDVALKLGQLLGG
jgi:putative sterol carrier protein